MSERYTLQDQTRVRENKAYAVMLDDRQVGRIVQRDFSFWAGIGRNEHYQDWIGTYKTLTEAFAAVCELAGVTS